MEAEIQAIASAFLGPLQGSISGVHDAMMPLLMALTGFIICFAALTAAFRREDILGGVFSIIMTMGITIAALEYWPPLLDWSIEQAGALTSLGGAGSITTPFEVGSAGMALWNRAADHAGAVAGYLPSSGWITAFLLQIVGLGLFVVYLLISAISLSAFIEFFAAGIVLAPLVCFLPVVGFTGAGFTPISFIMSATLRIAALGFLASYGTGLIAEFALPPVTEEVTLGHVGVAAGIAVVLGILAWKMNSMITGILMGRPGWSGAGMVFAAAGAAASMAAGGLSGAAGMAKTAMSASASKSGGGSPSAGSGGGSLGVRTQPVNTARP